MVTIISTIALLVALLVLRATRRTSEGALASDAPPPPVCGRCGYPLGGWSSSRCPECGRDVRRVGVRVGKPVRFAAAALLFFVGGALLTVPPAAALLETAFRVDVHQRTAIYSSGGESSVLVIIRSEKRPFRATPRLETEVTLRFRNIARETLRCDGTDAPPPATEIADAVRRAVGPTIDRVQVDAIARDVGALIDPANRATVNQPGTPGVALLQLSGTGSSSGSRIAWSGYAMMGVLLSFLLVVSVSVARRWVGSNRRKPYEEEWARPAATPR